MIKTAEEKDSDVRIVNVSLSQFDTLSSVWRHAEMLRLIIILSFYFILLFVQVTSIAHKFVPSGVKFGEVKDFDKEYKGAFMAGMKRYGLFSRFFSAL
jgi:hypothetical protein